jgi:hypothetical protein
VRASVKRLEDLTRKPYVHGLPEWNLFPDDAARRKAIEEIERGMMPRLIKGLLQFLAAVVIFFGAPMLIAHLVAHYALPFLGRWNNRLMWIVAIAGYTIVVYLALRRDMPKALRQQLVKAGVPVCLKCGYDLRGLPSHRTNCPECGREFKLEVAKLLSNPSDASDSAHG